MFYAKNAKYGVWEYMIRDEKKCNFTGLKFKLYSNANDLYSQVKSCAKDYCPHIPLVSLRFSNKIDFSIKLKTSFFKINRKCGI